MVPPVDILSIADARLNAASKELMNYLYSAASVFNCSLIYNTGTYYRLNRENDIAARDYVRVKELIRVLS